MNGTIGTIKSLSHAPRHILRAAQSFVEGIWRLAHFRRYHARKPFAWTVQRWVTMAASGKERVAAFSALDSEYTPHIFAPAIVPTLQRNMQPWQPPLIGKNRAEQPYQPASFVNISGMSYGALSKSAIKALLSGAEKAGCWVNSGEGALSPYHSNARCDIILQLGTGKFGLRNAEGALDENKLKQRCQHPNIKMIEIKLSQGGKPGKGGYLPGDKVRGEVAALLEVPEGENATSPAQHVEVRDLPSLFSWLHHLRTITGKPVGFKCAATDRQEWLHLCRTIAELPKSEWPDFITVDSGDAGTGGAPQTLMQSVGLPLTESLPILHALLTQFGLRKEITLIGSGHIITPDHAAQALRSGADILALGRGPLLAMGCVQALQCHRNSCPMGIASHNSLLEARFSLGLDKGDRVGNYITAMREDVEMIAAACGATRVNELREKHSTDNTGALQLVLPQHIADHS